MLFGSNNLSPVAGQTAYRVYYQQKNGVPAGVPMMPAGITPIISIRPNIEEVLDGGLDSRLNAYFQNCFKAFGAPVLLTAYHEANDPNEHQEASQILALHKYLMNLAGKSRDVLYGAIVGCYPPQHENEDLSQWVPQGISWAGMDGYRVNETDTPDTVFDPSREKLEKLAHSLLITETNVFGDGPNDLAAQSEWLVDSLEYASDWAMQGYLIYYNHPGTDTPPAPSQAMIAALSIRAATAGIA